MSYASSGSGLTDSSQAPRGRPAGLKDSWLHRGIGGRWIHATQDPREIVDAVLDLVAGVIVRIRIHVSTLSRCAVSAQESRPAAAAATPRGLTLAGKQVIESRHVHRNA